MIPLSPDPDDIPRWLGSEHCCFCGAATRLWHAPRDVAVCASCAETHEEAEVPTKDEWCESPQAYGFAPLVGTVVFDRMHLGRRLTLRRTDDGIHHLYVNDVEDADGGLDTDATIAWLATLAGELTSAPPAARDWYGSELRARSNARLRRA